MAVLLIDPIAGISGDMTVGALLALGLPMDVLRGGLDRLNLGGYRIQARRVEVNGIKATKFDVAVESAHGAHEHRAFAEIRGLIDASGLDAAVKERALAVFTRLAEAEGSVHGVPAEEVVFHEVGAVDSIVDIVAVSVGLAHFGVARAYVGSLPVGSGLVTSRHGALPVPAPATVELLRGFPVRMGEGTGELVTPTGAAIVAAIAEPNFPPPIRPAAIGYGAGTRRLEDRPNVLRLVIGAVDEGVDRDQIAIIETNIDDMAPEFYDLAFERLLAAGAVDVHLVPVQMKKNRPGILLRVLCAPADRDRVAAVVLGETSAIGVRFGTLERYKLRRESHTVLTEYGEVRVKVARAPDGHANVAPEYEDCASIARRRGVPVKLVYQAAIAAFYGQTGTIGR